MNEKLINDVIDRNLDKFVKRYNELSSKGGFIVDESYQIDKKLYHEAMGLSHLLAEKMGYKYEKSKDVFYKE